MQISVTNVYSAMLLVLREGGVVQFPEKSVTYHLNCPLLTRRKMCIFKNSTFSFPSATRSREEKFDRSQWKIMQQTMLDSAKFVDMLHNVPWEDGLPTDVVYGTRNTIQYNAINCSLFPTQLTL